MRWLWSTLAALAMLPQPAPTRLVDELLAADRAHAAAAQSMTVVPALSAMFADDIVMPVGLPAPGFARGRAKAVAALDAIPANRDARVTWAPVRGGVSADGQHGFTVGYLTLTSADGAPQPGKYVAYWIRQPDGWRVAVYRRVPASAPPSSRDVLPPALPPAIVAPTSDPGVLARHKASLQAAEQSFSDDAQQIGLGPAFAKHGSADAMNVGPPDAGNFVVGAAAIGDSVGRGSEGKPSPVAWAADEGALVASSGDLGVTFGYIRPHVPPAGRPAAVPFVTIWRRAAPEAPWRYVAE